MSDNTDQKKKKAEEFLDQASNTGDISLLYRSLSVHCKVLDEIEKEKFIDTPLHTAARLGHSKFCAEMMNLMPSFGRKLNADGFSPLHLALEHGHQNVVPTSPPHLALKHGHQKVVRTLVDIDKELVRVKGRDGITPLIYCARSAVYNSTLATFLRDCPQAIFDKNTTSQTALHVALKEGNREGAVIILNWLRRTSMEKILDWKDDEGNTPLHLATRHSCKEAMKMLLQNSRLNKRNDGLQTPLDIALTTTPRDEETVELLKSKKAKTSGQLAPRLYYVEFLKSPMSCCESAIQKYTIMMNDLDANMRNVVLVVAVLIAAATYTAMLQPPGGIYQANATDTTTTNRTSSVYQANVTTTTKNNHIEQKSSTGKMVMNHYNFKRFMPMNTLAFTLAIVVIIFVLPGRPYTVFLHLSLLSLSYSCLIAMTIVSEEGTTANVSFFLAWSLLALAVVVKLSYFLLKGFMWEVWWMPNFFVQMRNLVESCPGAQGTQESMSLMSTLRKQYILTVNSLSDKP